ncbi:hypothetical protein Tco_1570513 [Tanacetum coccineum]
MVGGNSSTLQAWDDTIGKLKARLFNWKLKTLSVGGRLTLLKSVLGSTPIYNMSIYKVPKSVLQTMESIRRNFFNDWLNWFNSIRLSSKVKDLLEGVLYITWWSIWMFRNQLLFLSKAPRKDVIFDDIVSRSFTYCLSRYMGISGVGNSYVHVVKGKTPSVIMESDSTPALVLDEECLNLSDLSNSLFGRVKEFASLSNLKMKLQKKLFHANVGVGSWFSQLVQASMDFTIEEGDLKVADKGLCGGESDVEEVMETLFGERFQNNNNMEEMSTSQKENHSGDPFNIYTLLNKNKDIAERENNSDQSLKYPPGYTPNDGTYVWKKDY